MSRLLVGFAVLIFASAPLSAGAQTLAAILEAQPEAAIARYDHRHPQQTLEFFDIAPGMTVVEVLPGGGWYSKILIPYLGANGQLIGANYSSDLWKNFGFATPEFLAGQKTWIADWSAGAEEWRTSGDDASVSAFVLGDLPNAMNGQADAVLFIRALHNLARFSAEQDFFGTAISNAYDALKPGGILGVVQHEARANMPDDWASGQNGYLKRQFVIDSIEAKGFEYVDASEINQNPKDQPGADDFVWRLPPRYQTSGDDAEKRAAVDAIGESNRMTLKFRKPR